MDENDGGESQPQCKKRDGQREISYSGMIEVSGSGYYRKTGPLYLKKSSINLQMRSCLVIRRWPCSGIISKRIAGLPIFV
jgi:hypothetical protein